MIASLRIQFSVAENVCAAVSQPPITNFKQIKDKLCTKRSQLLHACRRAFAVSLLGFGTGAFVVLGRTKYNKKNPRCYPDELQKRTSLPKFQKLQ